MRYTETSRRLGKSQPSSQHLKTESAADAHLVEKTARKTQLGGEP